jgi:hypothetical protein
MIPEKKVLKNVSQSHFASQRWEFKEGVKVIFRPLIPIAQPQ